MWRDLLFCCRGGMLVLLVLNEDHADGALAAGVARIRLLVEGDLLALLHLLESAVGDGRVMEEEVFGSTLRGDKAEATIAQALDSSVWHGALLSDRRPLRGCGRFTIQGTQVVLRYAGYYNRCYILIAIEPLHYSEDEEQGLAMKTIRALRQERSWTQFELALKVGVHPQAVYLWESGRRTPQVVQMRNLGRIFGMCSDEIELEHVEAPRADEAAVQRNDGM